MDQLSLAPWERESIDWGEPVRVVTWNVNGIRAVEKKGLHQVLENLKPTFFCAQETKALQSQCGPELQDSEKWCSFWSSAQRAGYSGVATYCRGERPLEHRVGMGIEKFDSEGRLVLTKHPQFTILNMYFPNGGSGPERQAYKMEFLAHALPFFKKLQQEGHKLVICGDYNIAHKEIDIYDPEGLSNESGFLPEERKWMDELMKAGFVDAFRHFHPNEKNMFTWWTYFSGARMANRGWRIDYIFISQSLLPNLKNAQIHPDITGSDHCPVSADFEF